MCIGLTKRKNNNINNKKNDYQRHRRRERTHDVTYFVFIHHL